MAFILDYITWLYWLVVAHGVTDIALQHEWMGKYKYRQVATDDEYTGVKDNPYWLWVLAAHSIINGGGVALVSGSVILGVVETIAHFAIDYGSTNKYYSFNVDQFLHGSCKVIYALVLSLGLQLPL